MFQSVGHSSSASALELEAGTGKKAGGSLQKGETGGNRVVLGAPEPRETGFGAFAATVDCRDPLRPENVTAAGSHVTTTRL